MARERAHEAEPPVNDRSSPSAAPHDVSRPAKQNAPAPVRPGSRRGRARIWVRRGLLVLLGLSIVTMLVLAWLPQPVPVDAAAAVQQPMEVTVDEDGRTRVKDRYIISAPVYGNLARIGLRAGAKVEEGQVLARLAPLSPALLDPRSRAEAEARVAAGGAAIRQTEAAAERAQAALEFAERELQRQRQLKAQGAVPPQAVERAELDVRQRREEVASARFATRVSQHELEMARVAVRQARGERMEGGQQMQVSAPVQGTVLRVLQESEGVVQAGTPLLEIGDPAALEIVVDVLTQEAVRIQPGAMARIVQWGGEPTLQAHVRSIEPSAFTRVSALGVEEQRVNAILDLDDPHEVWSQLGDGYRVEAEIEVWREDDVLQVPDSAVFRAQQGHAVYRVADGRAQLRQVRVGRRNGVRAQILDGLAAGDLVVEHPSDRVQDGVAVALR
jgi:HlyD family secretion protein